jgi:hypothetical protein
MILRFLGIPGENGDNSAFKNMSVEASVIKAKSFITLVACQECVECYLVNTLALENL